MIDPRLSIPTLEADFEAVVDSIRKTGIITDSVVSGNSTLLTTDNTNGFLKKNQVLLIDGKDCRIDDATTIEITVNQAVDGATLWKALFPYFMDGHIMEVSKRLTEKDKSNSNTLAYEKYPLIILLQDIDYKQGKIIDPEVSVDFIIVNGTNGEYITEQRRVNNFEPILDPIFNDLMNVLRYNAYFGMSDNSFTASRKYYWGSSLANSNPFNDKLDAIEVNDLNLELRTKNC